MPWTKHSYPVSMKNLPGGTRAKAIQIANAILKEKTKMKEGAIIATAIKKAEAMAAKPAPEKSRSKATGTKKKAAAKSASTNKSKSKGRVTKTKTAAATKRKVTKTRAGTKTTSGAAKTISKPQVKKKALTPAKKKVNAVVPKKSKKLPVKKVKTASTEKTGTASKLKQRPKPVSAKVNKPTIQPQQNTSETDDKHIDVPVSEVLHTGENLHFIPEKGDTHPITPFESHTIENILHNREEVAFHQQNQKVKEALASRKNDKRTY
ncbi:MAG: hypothetical protein ABI855_11930, partial [Bacteroidota bacterium]